MVNIWLVNLLFAFFINLNAIFVLALVNMLAAAIGSLDAFYMRISSESDLRPLRTYAERLLPIARQ